MLLKNLLGKVGLSLLHYCSVLSINYFYKKRFIILINQFNSQTGSNRLLISLRKEPFFSVYFPFKFCTPHPQGLQIFLLSISQVELSKMSLSSSIISLENLPYRYSILAHLDRKQGEVHAHIYSEQEDLLFVGTNHKYHRLRIL